MFSRFNGERDIEGGRGLIYQTYIPNLVLVNGTGELVCVRDYMIHPERLERLKVLKRYDKILRGQVTNPMYPWYSIQAANSQKVDVENWMWMY